MAPPLEISIPKTSISTDNNSKPYTLYHITLSLPLRDHTTTKRYSDFVSLHSSLTSQTSLPPPAPLPAKSWLSKTVSNAALTEQRRAGLETYIRAIVSAEDGRWRQSSAWRTFLNLPKGLIATDGSSSRAGAGAQADGSRSLDAHEWLDVHREVKQQIHNARIALKKRDAAQTAQEQHGLSADAKAALVRAATGIARCEDSLKVLGGGGADAGQLGEGEIRRRRDLLGSCRKEVEGLETLLRNMALKSKGSSGGQASAGTTAAATEGDKNALFKSSSDGPKRSGRVLGGPMKETERTRELDNDGVLQLQQQIFKEQDEDVMVLGQAVSRMKEMGIMINEELIVQGQMLDLLDQDVDRVDGKISVAKKRIGKIS